MADKLRKIDKFLSYTTVRGHVLDILANIGLDPKKFGLQASYQVVLQQPTLV